MTVLLDGPRMPKFPIVLRLWSDRLKRWYMFGQLGLFAILTALFAHRHFGMMTAEQAADRGQPFSSMIMSWMQMSYADTGRR